MAYVLRALTPSIATAMHGTIRHVTAQQGNVATVYFLQWVGTARSANPISGDPEYIETVSVSTQSMQNPNTYP